MRQDIFIHAPKQGDHGTNWRLYVPAVLPSCAPYIIRSLESQGEHVRTFQSRNAGRMLYETAPR